LVGPILNWLYSTAQSASDLAVLRFEHPSHFWIFWIELIYASRIGQSLIGLADLITKAHQRGE
jgi:hypothetical protein